MDPSADTDQRRDLDASVAATTKAVELLERYARLVENADRAYTMQHSTAETDALQQEGRLLATGLEEALDQATRPL
jgi:hypothetical protein